jgi:hypothetical protein
MAPENIPDFDRAHGELLARTYGNSGLSVPHRLYMFAAQALQEPPATTAKSYDSPGLPQ